MASSYRSAITKFAKRNSGPTGDTKYDIFNRGGPQHNYPPLTREQLRHARTAPRHRVHRRRLKPASSGFVPGETV